MARTSVLQRAASGDDVSFNLTPMIDCTFQLIIFFILATQMANDELAKRVDIPRPFMSQSMPPKDLAIPNRLIVNVVSADPDEKSEDEMAKSNAQFYKVAGERIDVGNEERLAELIKIAKDRAEAEGLSNEKEEGREYFIEVRADKRVNWLDVAPVIRASVAAGIRKMSITALTEPV